jgi:hypothetical protein
MKNIGLIILLVLLTQCKIGQSSTGTADVKRAKEGAYHIKPDFCQVNAKIVRLNAPGEYTLRVYQVLEMGFGFNQVINEGDKINVKAPIELPVGEIIDIFVLFVKDQNGGYYVMGTSAE